MEWITCGIQSIQGALREKYPIFFGFCRKLARTKTPKSTDKVRKHNWCTVFSTVFLCASIDSVKFVFYPLSSCNVTYSLSLTTSLLYSFHWDRYWCHLCESQLRVCYSGWYTITTASSDTASNTLGQGCLFLWFPVGRRWQSRCLGPTFAVPIGMGHCHKFIIPP